MPRESGEKPAVRMEDVTPDHAGQRLDNYLAGKLSPVPRGLIYKIIRTGQVRVNGGRAKPARRLKAGDRVRIPPVRVSGEGPPSVPEAVLQELPGAIIHEDDELLVLNKPAGMAVHGGSGLAWGLIDAVRAMRPASRFELVHRLDRETSGCLLLAKNKQSMRHLQAEFRKGRPEKKYLCLLSGSLSQPHVVVEQPLLKIERGGERHMVVDQAGKPAQTEFRLLDSHGCGSYVEALLLTGRTHQIRAHAAFLGAPLAGDQRYGTAEQTHFWKSRGLNRLFLHAHSLAIRDRRGAGLYFSAPLPPELSQILEAL